MTGPTGLSGSLKVISFASLARFLAGLRKSGTLHISQGEWAGDVCFDRGDVVAAAVGPERGLDALDALALALGEGQFAFSDSPPPPERNVELSTEQLHTHLDELAAQQAKIAQVVPSLSCVPRVVEPSGPAPDDAEIELDRRTIRTLLAVDGRRTVGEIAVGRGLLQTIRDLVRLVEAGMVAVDPPAAAPSPPQPPRALAAPPPASSAPVSQAPGAPAAASAAAAPATAAPQPANPAPTPASQARPAGIPAAPAAATAAVTMPQTTCPKLGYNDDPANHYSRPVQLHRCYALAYPERIPVETQRDLCLTDKFSACPRYVAALSAGAAPAGVEPTDVEPTDVEPTDVEPADVEPAGADITQVANVVARPDERAVPRPPSKANGVVGPPGRVQPNGPAVASAATAEGAAVEGPAERPRAAALSAAAAAPAAPKPPAPPTPPEQDPAAAALPPEQHPADVPPPERPPATPPVDNVAGAAPAAVETPVVEASAVEAPTALAPRRRQPLLVPIVVVVGIVALVLVGLIVLRFAGGAVRGPSVPLASNGPGTTGTAGPGLTPATPGAVGTVPGAALNLRTLIDERFGTNQRNWPNNPQSTAWLASDGTYHLAARQPGQFVAVGAPGVAPVRDVAVTATFRKVGGPPGGGYGVIVRDQGPGPRDGVNQAGRYYVFEVGDRGEVGIWRRENDRWADILAWTKSEAVRTGGEPNQIEVIAYGPQLAFTVNGTRVATQTDNTLTEGTVGVFAGGDGNEAVVDRFAAIAPS